MPWAFWYARCPGSSIPASSSAISCTTLVSSTDHNSFDNFYFWFTCDMDFTDSLLTDT
jgi:hypothetical protein